jgi:ABC-type transporter Mla subunit MlaD
MKNDQRNYILVGVFVLAMLAGLIVWIITLSGGGRAVEIYQTRFESVLGLTAGGTQVHYNGFPVGKIETIRRSNDGAPKLFVLELSVEEGWQIA